MTLYSAVLKALRLPRERRRLVIESVWLLLLARATRFLNRRAVPAFFSRPRARQSGPSVPLQTLSWAIQAARRGMPMRPNCLVEATAAWALFNRHGHVTRLRIGVAKETEQALAAHAWVENDDGILIGKSRTRFTPLS